VLSRLAYTPSCRSWDGHLCVTKGPGETKSAERRKVFERHSTIFIADENKLRRKPSNYSDDKPSQEIHTGLQEKKRMKGGHGPLRILPKRPESPA